MCRPIVKSVLVEQVDVHVDTMYAQFVSLCPFYLTEPWYDLSLEGLFFYCCDMYEQPQQGS